MHPCAKARGCNPRRGDEIPPLLCPSAILPSFVFRADTLCSWNDGSVLSRFLLRKHCRVGTFVRIDLSPCCCAAHSICSIQSCVVSMRPCTLVAWLKPLHPSHLELWFFQPCHHTHISSSLDTEIRTLSATQSHDSTNTESDEYSQEKEKKGKKKKKEKKTNTYKK